MPPSLRTAAWCWCHLLAAQHCSMMQGTGGSGGFFFWWLVYNSYTRSVKDSNRLEPRAIKKTKESSRKLQFPPPWSPTPKALQWRTGESLGTCCGFHTDVRLGIFSPDSSMVLLVSQVGPFQCGPKCHGLKLMREIFMDLHERFQFQILRYPALFYSFLVRWDLTISQGLWSDHLQDGFASLFSTPSGSTLRQMSEVGKW